MITAPIGTRTRSSNCPRCDAKPAGRAASGSAVPSPGHSRQTAASRDQPVARPVTSQATRAPPGTRKGRSGPALAGAGPRMPGRSAGRPARSARSRPPGRRRSTSGCPFRRRRDMRPSPASETAPETRPMTTGTPAARGDPAQHPGPGAVQAGGGLGPPGAHDPCRAAGQQDPDEHDRADPAQHLPPAGEGHRAVGGDRAAVAGEHGLHRVDQAVQRGDLPGGQHDQHRQDRDRRTSVPGRSRPGRSRPGCRAGDRSSPPRRWRAARRRRTSTAAPARWR